MSECLDEIDPKDEWIFVPPKGRILRPGESMGEQSPHEERLANLERLERDCRAVIRDTHRLMRPTASGVPDILANASRFLESAHGLVKHAIGQMEVPS